MSLMEPLCGKLPARARGMFPLAASGKIPQSLRMGNAVANFRLNLEAEIARRGISKRALSLKAGLGPDVVRDIFRKDGGFTLATAEALADALGRSLQDMTSDPAAPSAEHDLIETWQAIPSEKRPIAMTLMKALAESA